MAFEEVAGHADVVGGVFGLGEYHERRGNDPHDEGDQEDEPGRQEDFAAAHGVAPVTAPAAVTAQRGSAGLTQTG